MQAAGLVDIFTSIWMLNHITLYIRWLPNIFIDYASASACVTRLEKLFAHPDIMDDLLPNCPHAVEAALPIKVHFKHVSFAYSRRILTSQDEAAVLRDINLSLDLQTQTSLIGKVGSGKSTLLKLMYLAHRPSRGLIHMFGQDTASVARKNMPALRRRIGVVFQDFRLIEHLSALENVALPLRVAGADEGQLREHVAELLRWVGLENEIHSLPSHLSGGQQQRVAIARAVIGRPDLLLADEPTGNVDNTIAVRILYLLEELNKIGTTVIIATHNEALISRFKFPQLRIEGGRVIDTAADSESSVVYPSPIVGGQGS